MLPEPPSPPPKGRSSLFGYSLLRRSVLQVHYRTLSVNFIVFNMLYLIPMIGVTMILPLFGECYLQGIQKIMKI